MDIKKLLKELGLKWMAENVDAVLAASKERKTTPAETLGRLLDGEREARMARSVQRRLRAAKVPVARSLADFNWAWPKKIDKDMVMDIFRFGFLKDNGNVVFMGGVGLGKTFLSSALAIEACGRNIPTLFTTTVDMVNNLQAAAARGCLAKAVKTYTAPQLLHCDEFGYLPVDQQGAHLLFQVISGRCEKGSTIVTTNKPYRQWTSTLANDAALTAALLDRLAGNCKTVVIEGDSYRMRDKLDS